MVQESVDKGAGGMSGSRMHDQSGGFVEDDQVPVLVEDFQRAGFGDEFQRLRRREGPGQLIPGVQAVRRSVEHRAVETDVAVGKQPLGGSAGGDFRMSGQHLIGTRPRRFRIDLQKMGGAGTGLGHGRFRKRTCR